MDSLSTSGETVGAKAPAVGGPWHYQPPRFERLRVAVRNWWLGAFGRRAAFVEGRNIAIDSAACKAMEFGRPDIADAINALVYPANANPEANPDAPEAK